jgi:hypothetical protein
MSSTNNNRQYVTTLVGSVIASAMRQGNHEPLLVDALRALDSLTEYASNLEMQRDELQEQLQKAREGR